MRAAERALQEVLIAAAEARLLRSAHDLSDGGLAVALAECCMGGPWATSTFGAIIDLDAHAPDVSDDGFLFGEDGARAIVSCAPADVAALQRIAAAQGVSAHYLGLVGEADTDLIVNRDGRGWTWQTAALRQKYFDAIPHRMAAPVTASGEE